jgi:molybdopterin-containing oxidoreductase family iron-sulfur binding subunit
MKLKINHPAPTEREASGPRYWRSLDELSDTPAFKDWLEKEFPAGASIMESNERRGFLKIMAASFGLAGLGMAGCRQQTRHLLPYSKQPDRVIPGVPVFYTSSMPGADENIPLIVETHDARPTKIEGNPSYAATGGATSVHAQSSILDLYDPDRAQRSSNASGVPLSPAQVTDVLKNISADYSANGGEGLYFLADRSNSPTRAVIVKKLLAKFPKATWAEFEAIDQSNPERAATAYAGRRARPVYDFSKATRVLALDSDFLHGEPGHLGYAKGFAKARRIQNGTDADPEKMIRLYSVESNFSLTGANADHRLRVSTAHMMGVAALIAAEILSQSKGGVPQSAMDAFKQAGAGVKVDSKWITECAKDLLAHGQNSAVIAGPQLPVELHQLVHMLNGALGSLGTIVKLSELPEPSATSSLADVAKALDAGQVKTLFILNGNPAYNAPGDLAFADKLSKLKAAKGQIIRYGYYGRQADETSALSDTFIAGLHYLESWSDGLTWDGFHVPVQPMIMPLFEGHGELDVLATLAGDAKPDAYGYVHDTFTTMHPGKSFEEWLAVGVAGSGFAEVTKSPSTQVFTDTFAAAAKFTAPVVDDTQLEVRFIPGITGDGRFANNGWLQECPDPMTKLTWDNAIFISPKFAKQKYPELLPGGTTMSKGPLGLLSPQSRMNDNDFVAGREIARIAEVTVNGQTIKGPVSILPGLADYTLVIPLGYGRKLTGSVGSHVGFDAFPLVNSTATMACSATGATFKLTDETYRLANVQEHWSMEGRAIIREASVDDYKAHPEFVKDMEDSPPIYGKDEGMSPQDKATKIPRGTTMYETHPNNVPAPNVAVWNTPEGLKDFPTPQQWGMSIDLNTCLGCTACLVACQAENNIPIVGKDQVMRGREMHWIRLDRYFASGPIKGKNGEDIFTDANDLPEDPQVNFQSVACQHCELAPCESVCPFMATLHDDSGLNVMAYNRCVGTKYCANNCPYKVRRFNFFDWNKREIGEFYKGPLGPDYYDTDASQLTRMQKNPDVSVRMRGVMEKCTYCVQRIEAAKITARVKARDSGDTKVADGDLVPACAQACPTDSIVFGDVSDANSAVSKAKASDRNYAVLGYLNIRPRTTYLAKIRNPNPAITGPGESEQPLSRQEYDTHYGNKTESATQPATGAPKS